MALARPTRHEPMILAAQALLWLNRLLWYFLWIFPHYFSAEVALTDRTGCDSAQGSVVLSSRSGLEQPSQDKPRKAPEDKKLLLHSTPVSQLRAVNNPDTHLGRHKKPLSPPCLLQTSHCPSPPPCSPLGRHSLFSILVKEKERKGEAATSAANRSFAASCLAPA